jgi:predicted nucleic acid-binding protein
MGAAQLSYWDALIVAAAERSGARYLLSEDFQADRQYGDVRVVNPFTASVP